MTKFNKVNKKQERILLVTTKAIYNLKKAGKSFLISSSRVLAKDPVQNLDRCH